MIQRSGGDLSGISLWHCHTARAFFQVNSTYRSSRKSNADSKKKGGVKSPTSKGNGQIHQPMLKIV